MVWVLKNSGTREVFDAKKVVDALMRSGASQSTAHEIAKKVEAQAYDGIPTNRIFAIAYDLLDVENPATASIFSLKQALMMLGPQGFIFEKLIATILGSQGYKTQGSQILKGACVDQEVDIVAEKGGIREMVECKYHNQLGVSTGLKEAMYTWARLMDVIEGGAKFSRAWIITNTKVTDEALKYASKKEMKVTSWGYPEGESLQDLIKKGGMYPITILKMSENARHRLLQREIITLKDLTKVDLEEYIALTGETRDVFNALIEQTKGIIAP